MRFNYDPVQTTPFSRLEKLKARMWRVVWLFLFRPTPWFMWRFRVFLLRLFGADVSYKARVSNSSFIEFPWNLSMQDCASLGERSWVYCLDKVGIGKYACVGQDVRLITGSHDFRSPRFEMITAPISIGEGAWLTSDVTVLMGVDVGSYSVIGVKSLVSSSIPENTVAYGSPAKPVKKRF